MRVLLVRRDTSAKMAFDLLRYWLTDRHNKLILALALSYLVALTVASTFTAIPIGIDVHFHFDVAAIWARGQNGMFSSRVLELNLFPYPPVFHWLLVPSVWFGFEFLMAKFLQVALPFGIFLATIMFMSRHTNPKATLLTAMFLVSTIGFTDGTIQCRPMGLSIMLVPLALHSIIESNGKQFVVSNSLIAYTHGIAGIANTWLPSLHRMFNRKMSKTIAVTVLVLSPLVIVSAIYFGGALNKWGGHMDTYQEYLVFTQPFTMIPYYAGFSLIGWVFVAQTLLRWSKSSDFERVITLSVLGLTVMVPFWADRFLQYAIIGLSCLAGAGIAKNRRLFYILVPLMVFMAVANLVNIYWITFTDNWWLYPQ